MGARLTIICFPPSLLLAACCIVAATDSAGATAHRALPQSSFAWSALFTAPVCTLCSRLNNLTVIEEFIHNFPAVRSDCGWDKPEASQYQSSRNFYCVSGGLCCCHSLPVYVQPGVVLSFQLEVPSVSTCRQARLLLPCCCFKLLTGQLSWQVLYFRHAAMDINVTFVTHVASAIGTQPIGAWVDTTLPMHHRDGERVLPVDCYGFLKSAGGVRRPGSCS